MRLKKDLSECLSAPLHVSIDVTNKCMAKCLHCYNRSGILQRDELNDKEMIDVFHQVADMKPHSVCFCGGEPLIRFPILIEGAKIFDAAGIPHVSMVSNGYLMTVEKAELLVKSGINMIQISLDGAKAETHERMRRIDGIFERALNAMKYVNSAGGSLSIAFSPTKFNFQEFGDVVKLVTQYKSLKIIRIQPLMPIGSAIENMKDIMPTENQYRFICNYCLNFNKINKNKCPTMEWGDPIDHLVRFNTLKFKQIPLLDVKADGSLVVSPYLPIKVGNVRRYKLRDYWDNGIGKVWALPIVQELADALMCIEDMEFKNPKVPLIYYEQDLEIDVINEKPFENPENFTLEKIVERTKCQLGGI